MAPRSSTRRKSSGDTTAISISSTRPAAARRSRSATTGRRARRAGSRSPKALRPTIGGTGADLQHRRGLATVAILVLVIGLALGGPTGYAINPARDLGPRIMHFVLPIAGKGGSDWAYAWIPVVGPVLGGIAGAVAARALFDLHP